MTITYLEHPVHGQKVANSDMEVKYDAANGWKVYDPTALKEPIVEEPIVEEPIVEEPIVEETIVEEPVIPNWLNSSTSKGSKSKK